MLSHETEFPAVVANTCDTSGRGHWTYHCITGRARTHGEGGGGGAVLYCEGFVLVLRPGPGSILMVRESGDWVILLTLVTAIGQVGVDRGAPGHHLPIGPPGSQFWCGPPGPPSPGPPIPWLPLVLVA